MQNMAEAGQLHKSALILLFAAAKRGRTRRSSLWRRPLRLSSSAMSYDLSGPRVVHKRKELRARRCSRSRMSGREIRGTDADARSVPACRLRACGLPRVTGVTMS